MLKKKDLDGLTFKTDEYRRFRFASNRLGPGAESLWGVAVSQGIKLGDATGPTGRESKQVTSREERAKMFITLSLSQKCENSCRAKGRESNRA